MYLSSLHITQFKNYLDARADFLPSFNLFTGLNGSGKTNLLDAIYYMAMTKSFFHNRDVQNVHHDHNFFRLVGSFKKETSDQTNELVAKVQPGQSKTLSWNGQEYDNLVDHIGQIPVMMSAPSDIRIVTDSSQIRRKYLDGFIGQMDLVYLKNLMHYNRYLRQRNAVLKKTPVDYTLIEVYTEKMAPAAAYISKKRKDIISLMLPHYKAYYSAFGGSNESSDIQYVSQLLKEDFLTASKQMLRKDSATGRTSVGIHRDDLYFSLNGEPAKLYASQGQIKSILFSLHLAKHKILKEMIGQSPILLLDDIFAKLDDQRVGQLMNILKQPEFGQIFISDTSKERLAKVFEQENIRPYRIFEIASGSIKDVKSYE